MHISVETQKQHFSDMLRIQDRSTYFSSDRSYETEVSVQKFRTRLCLEQRNTVTSAVSVPSHVWRRSGRAVTVIKRGFPPCILLLPAEMRFPLDAMDRERGATWPWWNVTAIRFQL